MNTHVLRAVSLRNFLDYFANPTGYLFICLFVLLSTSVTFCRPEFFAANLANLNLLNDVFPWIMLIFVPAITMGVWAEERRQGTDELLLTIPASDTNVVLGKYVAAVAIYTVSLLFSLVCNFAMLALLSEWSLDKGLFLGTYFGYWMAGLAMLAVGMVASFLTANLTVAYILGVLLNVPLVIAFYANYIAWPGWLRHLQEWSVGGQFRDFGRGLISLSGVLYFVVIMVVMLYVSMVLIGRRHWTSRQLGAMAGHYLARTVALAATAVALVLLFEWHDLRADVTAEKLSTLSDETRNLLKNLDVERPVRIEAFISPEVPEAYGQTKLNLETALREFDKLGGEKVEVRINQTERYSQVATLAEHRYGIRPRQVPVDERGTLSVESIFMHVVFTCGLEKVDPIYFDRGIPVEYELIRSVATVAQQKRKRIGVVATDAPLFAQYNFQTGSFGTDWPIISELEKQYDVEEVNLSSPLGEDHQFDALLVVQPSTLGPEAMPNLVAAIRAGVPTAIFEDPCPCPFFYSSVEVPATSEPRHAPAAMSPLMGRQPPPEKGDLDDLLDALGIRFDERQVVWQRYNPYKRFREFPDEFVFIDKGALSASGESDTEEEEEEEQEERDAASIAELYNPASPISSKLQHMLFCFPGAVRWFPSATTSLEFTELVRTGRGSGVVRYGTMPGELFEYSPLGGRGLNPRRRMEFTAQEYILAVQICGKKSESKQDEEPKNEGSMDAGPRLDEPPSREKINVVFVADLDLLTPEFFALREQGDIPDADVSFDFDNVTFVLNVLDVLAGEERFIEVRKRRPRHQTLSLIEKQTEKARSQAADARTECEDKIEEALAREQEAFETWISGLEAREGIDLLIEIALAKQSGQQRLKKKAKALEDDRDRTIDRIKTEENMKIDQVRNRYKFWAVALPPIAPLMLALMVFLVRRTREREGVAETRLR